MSSFLGLLSPYLPQHDGLLPLWLLFVCSSTLETSTNPNTLADLNRLRRQLNPSLRLPLPNPKSLLWSSSPTAKFSIAKLPPPQLARYTTRMFFP